MTLGARCYTYRKWREEMDRFVPNTRAPSLLLLCKKHRRLSSDAACIVPIHADANERTDARGFPRTYFIRSSFRFSFILSFFFFFFLFFFNFCFLVVVIFLLCVYIRDRASRPTVSCSFSPSYRCWLLLLCMLFSFPYSSHVCDLFLYYF